MEDRIQLTRVLQHPEKLGTVLPTDRPWEGERQLIVGVARDDLASCYKLWYFSACMQRHRQNKGSDSYIGLGYAESDDALHWRKPLFDLCPVGEHARTNFLHWGRAKPMLNPASDDPARRFIAVGLYYHDYRGLRPDGINLLYSPDGIHWQVQGDYHIHDFHSDTKNHLCYDPVRRRWLLYCRQAITASGRTGHGDNRRRILVSVSTDLQDWTYPEMVLCPDEWDTPDYDNCQVFHYGSHFLMFYAAMTSTTDGRMRLRLAYSADGIRFERFPTREDFIPMGEPGSFDGGILAPAAPPLRLGDRLLIYYNAMNLGQSEQRRTDVVWTGVGAIAALPPDRFVAQRAEGREGWLLTRHFLLEGNTLRLNFRTLCPSGSVQVEVVRRPPRDGHAQYYIDEHAAKGYTYAWDGYGLDACEVLRGDQLAAAVTWQGRDLAALQGQEVYLRFRLVDADLYSFRISQE